MKRKKHPRQNSSSKITFVIISIIFLLFICFQPEPVFAGELRHLLNVNAEISTGKYLKYNGVVPVTIDITNLEGDFSGSLELLSPRGYRSPDDVNIYYRDISIPRNGKKRFYLYIPKTSYYTSKVDVRVRKGRDYKDFNITFNSLQNHDKIIMVLNKDKGGFAYLSEFKSIVPQNTSLNIEYPDQHKLPIAWKAYGNIDFILINNLPALNLDQEKQKAILEYAITGGSVIFSTNLDPGEYNNSLFSEYLPLVPQKTVTMEQDENIFNKEDTVVMEGEAKGEVLCEYDKKPLLIHRKLGEGDIFLVTADFSQKPFNPDFEEKEIWARIFKTAEIQNNQGKNIDNTKILASLPEMASPPLDKIFWALLVYIVLIGPVNYFYLKKKDKLLYMFITIPIAALIFSSGIFLLGYTVKGSKILLRKFNVVYVSNNQPVAFVDSVVSLFSPGKTDYNLTLTNKGATGWEMGGDYGESPESKVKEDEYFSFEDLTIQMWSMRQFRIQRCEYFKEPLKINIKENNGNFTGTINNGTGMNLTGCVLFYKGSVSAPFDLTPGERTIDTPVFKKGLLSPYGLANHLQDVYGLTGDSKDNKNLKEAKINALSGIAESALKSANQMILIGWNEDDITKVTINKQDASVYNINLIYFR